MNAKDALSNASGISLPVMERLFKEVMENRQRLDSCKSHHFEVMQKVGTKPNRYLCVHCGGEIDHHAYYWFLQGKEMAA